MFILNQEFEVLFQSYSDEMLKFSSIIAWHVWGNADTKNHTFWPMQTKGSLLFLERNVIQN